ncbi:MAG: amidohydrolase family protein, partial [Clostridia bacterium]|nr:amidohydrolase family protein [Clostridia bacterium]
VDKILFGSDAPWNAPSQDMELIECFGLTQDEEKAVLGGNARKLLGI